MSCSIKCLLNYLNKAKLQYKLRDKNVSDKLNILISYLENLNSQQINEISDLNLFVTSFCSKYSSENKDKIDLNEILAYIEFRKVKTTIQKSEIVEKFPDLLVIRIQKIIDYDPNNGVEMIKGYLNFDEFLIVEEDGKKVEYELYSFLQHMGSSEYGHYISFKKYTKDKWVVINDSECIYFTWEQLKKNNPDPYMLFYRRINN